MKSKEVAKKIFWPVFIIVFLIIAGFIGKTVYDSILGAPAGQGQEDKQGTKISDAVFACENDNSVMSRAYVYLHGLGDHNPGAFEYQRGLIGNDPKAKNILDFDYDESLTLNELSEEFVASFDEFIAENDVEEIIIIGQSAGGVIASFSAHKLDFNGAIELHTLASPLNGYHVSDVFLKGTTGFAREIGAGFDEFAAPPENVRAYHHKTVEDESLRSWCGDYAQFCDPLKAQNNNLNGSKEFFYPEYNHASIMPAVSRLIIDCHQ